MNGELPERVSVLETNFEALRSEVQGTRNEVANVRSLVEQKTSQLLTAVEAKTTPNRALWLQFGTLMFAMLVAVSGLNWLVINARASKTEATIDGAVAVQTLTAKYTVAVADMREEFRKEREALILSNTKTESDAVHSDLAGQIKGLRSKVNWLDTKLGEHEKLPMHPVGEARMNNVESRLREFIEAAKPKLP